ncbi:MAG: CDP-diacylglycerol--glycerol-3-phosphate 3-phosphatidyltransferase [Actinomycetota bacterium]|nr:CDP-diacylglycerol--glycerol-3-phosphate 3-phosphatidyltransferase [Actinomycetota bacterium]
MSEERDSVFTIANLITTIRIVLIPVFVFVLLAPWPQWFPYAQGIEPYKEWLAAAVFAVLAMTDGVDGYLARSRNEVTTLGKFLDPLADKILVCAALLAFCELGTLPSWIALIIVAREFIVSGLRMVASSEGIVIAASWFGKAKTFVTIFAILMFIVKDTQTVYALGETFAHWFQVLSWVVMIVAVVLTVLSMIDYFAKAERELHMFRPLAKGGARREEDEIAEVILGMARDQGVKLATAESCTGGSIASVLTDIPGSSDVFLGGVVSYANEVKHGMLDVRKEDIDTFGAVSQQVAEQMVRGVSERLGADIAVSVTGIAGPGGGTAEKPVGTVWFGVWDRGDMHTECHRFEGDREQVRAQSTRQALLLVEDALR